MALSGKTALGRIDLIISSVTTFGAAALGGQDRTDDQVGISGVTFGRVDNRVDRVNLCNVSPIEFVEAR